MKKRLRFKKYKQRSVVPMIKAFLDGLVEADFLNAWLIALRDRKMRKALLTGNYSYNSFSKKIETFENIQYFGTMSELCDLMKKKAE